MIHIASTYSAKWAISESRRYSEKRQQCTAHFSLWLNLSFPTRKSLFGDKQTITNYFRVRCVHAELIRSIAVRHTCIIIWHARRKGIDKRLVCPILPIWCRSAVSSSCMWEVAWWRWSIRRRTCHGWRWWPTQDPTTICASMVHQSAAKILS